MKPVRVGLLGFGTVGSGTWAVLKRNSAEIARRAGREIQISRVAVKNPDKPRDTATDHIDLTDDPWSIVDAPDIDIVVELIGGIEPAYQYIRHALANGKHVVTANKELIAVHGNELFEIAQKSACTIAFEAAVCGGIPIIKALREGLAGNQIESLVGIINGTSNYILSGMQEQHCSFEEMLENAQRLGYAEADPRFDVEGVDALHKLTILASIAFGIPLQDLDDIHCEGISTITYEDIANANELGFTIKPLAVARRGSQGVEIQVHPSLISTQRLLAKVNGVMNAIAVSGDAAGRTVYYGPGAGSEATGSAVTADLIDVARSLSCSADTRVPYLGFQQRALSHIPMVPFQDTETANYLRLNAVNRAGVLAEIARILGDHKISIESILQKGSGHHEEILPVVIVTQETVEKNMHAALHEIEALETVVGKIVRIRIESLA